MRPLNKEMFENVKGGLNWVGNRESTNVVDLRGTDMGGWIDANVDIHHHRQNLPTVKFTYGKPKALPFSTSYNDKFLSLSSNRTIS